MIPVRASARRPQERPPEETTCTRTGLRVERAARGSDVAATTDGKESACASRYLAAPCIPSWPHDPLEPAHAHEPRPRPDADRARARAAAAGRGGVARARQARARGERPRRARG